MFYCGNWWPQREPGVERAPTYPGRVSFLNFICKNRRVPWQLPSNRIFKASLVHFPLVFLSLSIKSKRVEPPSKYDKNMWYREHSCRYYIFFSGEYVPAKNVFAGSHFFHHLVTVLRGKTPESMFFIPPIPLWERQWGRRRRPWQCKLSRHVVPSNSQNIRAKKVDALDFESCHVCHSCHGWYVRFANDCAIIITWRITCALIISDSSASKWFPLLQGGEICKKKDDLHKFTQACCDWSAGS